MYPEDKRPETYTLSAELTAQTVTHKGQTLTITRAWTITHNELFPNKKIVGVGIAFGKNGCEYKVYFHSGGYKSVIVMGKVGFGKNPDPIDAHKAECVMCDTDSLCPTGNAQKALAKERKTLTTKLRKEYQWRAKRYSENDDGYRSHGGNCFNETGARKALDEMESRAEEIGLDWREIRNSVPVITPTA